MSSAYSEADVAVTVTATAEVDVKEGLQDDGERRVTVLAQVHQLLRQLDERRRVKSVKTHEET